MTIYYCSINNGFYDSSVQSVPEGAKLIPDGLREALIGSLKNEGEAIGPDENGMPVLVRRDQSADPVVLSDKARATRDYLLTTTVDNINAVRWAAMPDSTKMKYIKYRQALLDVPSQKLFPFDIKWPELPKGK